MIRNYFMLTAAGLLLCACKPTPRTAAHKQQEQQPAATQPATTPTATPTETPQQPEPPKQPEQPRVSPAESIVAVNAVRQEFNPVQPWEKSSAEETSALGVYLGNGRVLSTGNVARGTTYVELALPDDSRTATAKVLRYDEDRNLALLGLEHEEDMDFFATRTPLLLGDAMALGDKAEVAGLIRGLTPVSIPLEAAGVEGDTLPRLTLRLTAPLPDGHAQGAPIVKGGRLVGISAGYEDMEIAAINAEQIERFLAQRENDGVPVLGVQFSPMDDPAFCAWLKADRGLYIGKVLHGSAAEQAGLQQGDVIQAVEGLPVDNQGRCHHPLYGLLNAATVIRTLKPLGESVTFTICRGGETQDIAVQMNRDVTQNALFATAKPGEKPRYAIWGGLVFQPLTETYLNAIRRQNGGNLPLEFQRLYTEEDALRANGYSEPVGLTYVIPTPAAMGYESVRFCMVECVNGKQVHNFAEFLQALDAPTEDGLVRFTLNKAPYDIYLDRQAAEAANELIRTRSIPKLREAGE